MKNKFDAIVVICAEEVGIEGENGERIKTGLDIAKKAKAAYFIFLGTKSHNQTLEKYLRKSANKLKIIYPTNRKEASTRTQIKDLSNFLKKNPLGKLLIVSHTYHIPRIKLYSKKYLSNKTAYSFWPVGEIENQKKQVVREMKKIIRYKSLGHL